MSTINQTLFSWIFSFAHRNPFIDALGVFCAGALAYAFLIAVCYFAFRMPGSVRTRISFAIEAVLVGVLSYGLIVTALHFLYSMPRPAALLGISPLIADVGASFPSGHATLLFALATTVFFVSRRWGMGLYALALINCIARIFAGVNWPFDVVAGAILGIASAHVIHALLIKDSQSQ